MQSAFADPRPTRDPQPADNLILWLPVFLMCGIGAYFLLPFEPDLRVLSYISAASVILTGLTWRLRHILFWRWAAAFVLAFVLGLVLIQTKTARMDVPLLNYSLWNKEISGRIDNFERVGTGWRVVLQNVAVGERKTDYVFRLTVRRKGFVPVMGGVMRANASVMAPSEPMIPDSFDFRRHAFFKGISGYGYVTRILAYTPPATDYRANTLEVYRDWLTEKVYAVLDQPEAGIVTALLNGQRAGINKESTRVLQKSGLQHVISISGLHVSLLAMVIFFCTRFLMACSMTLALRWPIKKIAAVFSLIGIVFYLLIVGSSPPTLRAVLVTGTALIAVMLNREAIQMRVVALAALAIMLVEPESVIDIGFQMSFAAVIGLVAFYQMTRSFWTHTFWKSGFLQKGLLLGVGTVATSIIATLVTAPLVLYYFQQVPLLSMLANVLASLPITFLVMPGTFLAYLFTPFPVLGEWAIWMMGWGVTLMMDVAHYVAMLPSSVWKMPPLPFAVVLLVMTGMWLVISVKHRVRWIGVAVIAAGIVLVPLTRMPDLYLAQGRVVLYPVQDSETVHVDGRLDKFNREIVLNRLVRTRIADFPCENEICDLAIKGKTVRLIRTVPALAQACNGDADLIISRYYLDHRCGDTPVVDRNSLRDGGGQAIWLDKNGMTTRSVRQKGQVRPWTGRDPYPRKFSGNRGRKTYNQSHVIRHQ